MKSSVLPVSLIMFALVASPGAAATRTVGQQLVYAVTTTRNASSGPPAGLPPGALAQYQATQAAGAKGTTSTFTFTIDQVSPDGSAHLNGSIASAMYPSASLAAVPYLNTLQAKLAPDGRIIPAYDPNAPNATTRDNKYHELVPTEASAQNTNARQFPASEFNTFAVGCAKRGQLRVGDSWHVQTQNAETGTAQTYDFSVPAAPPGDSPKVSMTSLAQGTYGSQKVEASGHYDMAARQVVDLHVVATYDNTTPGGHFAGTATTDIVLQH